MFIIDSFYNKATLLLPGYGYNTRPAVMSKYRSIICHTTNGKLGTTFSNEALYLMRSTIVSAHYLIGKEGRITQILDPHKYTAWHAGNVRAMKYSNPYAIGIEMHHTPAEGHCTTLQLSALDWLVRKLLTEYVIDPLLVETHRYVAIPVGRKIDPSGFPDLEFYAWRKTLSYTRYQVINVRGVNIRQAPNINAPIAGILAYNEVFFSDGVNIDENNQYINGVNTWCHMASGLGFIHMSNLKKVE